MPLGRVRFYSEGKGYGFIRPIETGEPDIFFHVTHVRDDLPETVLGARVGYDITASKAASSKTGDPTRATMATNIRFV